MVCVGLLEQSPCSFAAWARAVATEILTPEDPGRLTPQPRFLTAKNAKHAKNPLCAQTARIWSAVTCHRFFRFGDLSPKQGRVQRPARVGRLPAFDGDKAPAESA